MQSCHRGCNLMRTSRWRKLLIWLDKQNKYSNSQKFFEVKFLKLRTMKLMLYSTRKPILSYVISIQKLTRFHQIKPKHGNVHRVVVHHATIANNVLHKVLTAVKWQSWTFQQSLSFRFKVCLLHRRTYWNLFLGALSNSRTNSDIWHADIKVNNTLVNFRIDTGADATVIPIDKFNALISSSLSPSDKTFCGTNRNQLQIAGCFSAILQWYDKQAWQTIYVLNDVHQPLLG